MIYLLPLSTFLNRNHKALVQESVRDALGLSVIVTSMDYPLAGLALKLGDRQLWHLKDEARVVSMYVKLLGALPREGDQFWVVREDLHHAVLGLAKLKVGSKK